MKTSSSHRAKYFRNRYLDKKIQMLLERHINNLSDEEVYRLIKNDKLNAYINKVKNKLETEQLQKKKTRIHKVKKIIYFN